MSGSHHPGPPAVGYVLMGFPRVSETFIASELHRVERAGVPVRLFVVKPVEARERDLRHPVVDAIQARPRYLPDAASLTAPLHRWRRRDVAPFLPALRRVARRRPLGLARAAATTLAQALRDRRTPLSGPRKIYVKELLQAVALADAVLAAPEVRHLHAHFAHGTTTIAWHAARIAGLPFSFTGHARDIYAQHLNPKGWLRRKLLAARFVVTCTEANVRHLERIAPEARIHLVYHGLNADFARLVADGDERSRRRRARDGEPLRVLAVGRMVAKKGFDQLVEACAILERRGIPFEAAIVGQEDKDSARVRERIARHGLERRVRLPGPMGQAELLHEYRRAGALCMPSRLLARRSRRDPQRARRGDGGGHAGRGQRGVRHPRAGRARRQRGARRAGAACRDRRRARPPPRRSRAGRPARARGSRDRRDPVRRRAARLRAGPPVPRGAGGVTSATASRPRPVHCVTEHEHRSRAIADDVLRGRFTVAGETRALGADPDWLGADLPADEEWRIEWVKFGWGLDLAHAAAETGDPRYGEAWERLTASWIRQNEPPARTPPRSPRAGSLNWIYAWQRLSPPAGHEERLLASLAGQARARAREPRAGAQPPDARAVRAVRRRRSRCPSWTATACSTSPSSSWTATSRPTSGPTACTARRRPTTT